MISPEYADIVELSMRQSFGATEITISGSEGAWNTSDVLMFIKGEDPLRVRATKLCLMYPFRDLSDGVRFSSVGGAAW